MSNHDDIPPLLPPDQMPDITDQAGLHDTWRALMGELGFAAPQLWLLFIDDARPRHVMKVEDVPLRPGADEVRQLARMIEPMLDGRRSCAFLHARPGGRARTAGDLAWARSLAAISDRWPVHLANDLELRVVAPDDLAGADRPGAA